MKRTKSWWDQLSPSEKTELVLIERGGTYGQPRSERHQELIAKANLAENLRLLEIAEQKLESLKAQPMLPPLW
jgi:hypothetical protein